MFSTISTSLRRFSTAAAFLAGCAATLDPVTASADALFTWVKGPQTTAEVGVFAGAPGTLNPGARYWGATWTDNAGKLWLLGGFGLGSVPGAGNLNDLWHFDPITGNWAFIGGAQITNQPGSHGTKGVPAVSNVPGARGGAASWTGLDGRLWLFGGLGQDDLGSNGQLNDLMVYDPIAGVWTWIAGSNLADDVGILGSGPTASPSARSFPYFWTDSFGRFWLYGGFGRLAVGEGNLSDLWVFDPVTGVWSLVSGANVDIPPVHGTQDVPGPLNTPGSRNNGTAWTDQVGNFYLFGGDSAIGKFNDVWRYDPGTGVWTWVNGSDLVDQAGNYGVMNVAANTNTPGARNYVRIWDDRSGSIWMFGGFGRDSTGTHGELGDLWKYNTTTDLWTWVRGSNLIDAPGVWGTLGVTDPLNIPSARDSFGAWVDPNGTFWLFGGFGFEVGSRHSDLWRLNVTYSADVAVAISTSATTITLGQSYVTTVTLTNNGPDHARNVVAGLALGGQPLVNESVAELTVDQRASTGTILMPSLAPGESRALAFAMTPTLPGTATTTVQLQPTPADIVPANDTASANVLVIQGDGPDLVGGGSVTNSCRVTRTSFRCKISSRLTVTNAGNQDARVKTTLRFFLSDDDVLDPADTFLKDTSVKKLKILRSTTKKVKVTMPTGFSPSGKFVIAVVDFTGILAEGNEFNNTTVFGPLP